MKKKYGLGTFSLVLCVLALMWSWNLPVFNDLCIGDQVLSLLNIPTWSGYKYGNIRVHYTFISTLVFLIPAFVLGITHRSDSGAKVGMSISGVVMAYIVIMALAVIIF